jgi:hypothetical protein
MPNAKTDTGIATPRMAKRKGVIHVFESPGERAAFLATHRKGIDHSITITTEDGAEIQGRIIGAYVKVDSLWATVEMPADVDAAIGKGQPSVTVEFSADGSIANAEIDLSDSDSDDDSGSESDGNGDHEHPSDDDDSDCGCEACKSGGTCEAGSEKKTETASTRTPRKPTMTAKIYSPAVEAKFEQLIERYDGDPTALAYALIKANGKAVAELDEAKANGLPEGHVAVPKADADALAA